MTITDSMQSQSNFQHFIQKQVGRSSKIHLGLQKKFSISQIIPEVKKKEDNIVRGPTILNLKTFYRTKIIKTIWCGLRSWNKDQWNKIESQTVEG